jgi:zinc D-Ala-D-Ala dipeptidase
MSFSVLMLMIRSFLLSSIALLLSRKSHRFKISFLATLMALSSNCASSLLAISNDGIYCKFVSKIKLFEVNIEATARNFLNFFKLYTSLPVLLLLSCDSVDKKQAAPIVKHKVYVIKDSIAPQQKIIAEDTSYLENIFKNHNLIDIQSLDSSIRVDLKYADTSNFLKRDFYDGLKKAYFPCEVAIKICNAQFFLQQINCGYSLLIYDGARPLHVQQMMWDSLDMEPNKKLNYLAAPYSISLHNYGCAIDATIIDLSTGKTLDMGSDFDHFGKLSEPVYEWQFLKSGELSKEAFENRKLLRKVMQLAKLNAINSEWWHFNSCTKEYAAANFKLIK